MKRLGAAREGHPPQQGELLIKNPQRVTRVKVWADVKVLEGEVDAAVVENSQEKMWDVTEPGWKNRGWKKRRTRSQARKFETRQQKGWKLTTEAPHYKP